MRTLLARRRASPEETARARVRLAALRPRPASDHGWLPDDGLFRSLDDPPGAAARVSTAEPDVPPATMADSPSGVPQVAGGWTSPAADLGRRRPPRRPVGTGGDSSQTRVPVARGAVGDLDDRAARRGPSEFPTRSGPDGPPATSVSAAPPALDSR